MGDERSLPLTFCEKPSGAAGTACSVLTPVKSNAEIARPDGS